MNASLGADSCQKVNAVGRLPAGKRQSDINCRCAGCESVAPAPLCGIAVGNCGACQGLSAAASRLRGEVRGTPSESASDQTNRLSAEVAASKVLQSPPSTVPVLEGLRGNLRALNRCWDHSGPKSDKKTVALKFKHGELDTVFSADLNDTIRTTAPRFYCTCSVERLSDEGISQHRLVWPGQ